MNIHSTKLPGIGEKISFRTMDDSMIVLVTYHTGKRELYFFDEADEDEADFSIEMNADETRELGAQLLGATYQPIETEQMKLFRDKILMQWLKVNPTSPFAGKTIEEAKVREKTGASIVGIFRDDDVIASPTLDQRLEARDTIMAVGKNEQIQLLERWIEGEVDL
ncbi:cation:proton antiporter regulatory subunit [Texcoconibacillus texcoconensis]|uniref:TrkA domain protein n=1 Tax=Texcoconibacillus texcoconensis TaxID=1095777 RepID=A0A840QMP0_9BACI|nr:cation:proton antiporter regulatory subunit [Texcoconibacillus texcoconensis]MBB5172637.1 TrkA domain protein [Texcoconibacillus texcoconensis]